MDQMQLTSIDQYSARVSYLFGYPITHSLSPILHQTVYEAIGLPWEYKLLSSTDIELFLTLLREPRCYGSAVTMPHKVTIVPYLDELTEEGQQVGACNTIFFRNCPTSGRRIYVGTNTDVVGIREAFFQNVPRCLELFGGLPALVVGAGGSARSAIYALNRWFKPSQIYIVNRDAAEVELTISSCIEHGYGANLIHVSNVQHALKLPSELGAVVSCVPDLAPTTDAELVTRQIIETLLGRATHPGAMLEMAYFPKAWTRLAQVAHEKGWQVILGTEAMIWQGLEQDRLWTGKPLHELPITEVKKAVYEKVNMREMSVL